VPGAEGTPNIYSVALNPDIAHSRIELGGHYFANCDADRRMRVTLTDFSTFLPSEGAAPGEGGQLIYYRPF
jgi:hypothetical protein